MINDNQNDYELSSNNIVLNHKKIDQYYPKLYTSQSLQQKE